MEYIIDLENVTWERGNRTLLKNVDWQVKKGEHWALLGLNGSGKTSLLNIINGYEWPTIGTVHVLGNRFGATNVPELRKSIGWVSSSLQEKIYKTDLTQAVVISGKHASIGLYESVSKEDLTRALEMMEIMGCQYLVNRVYDTCSQGEKQKILIARALMANPQILILDEPCNGLDIFSREKLLNSINDLACLSGGPTLIYVTHHIEEISQVFQKMLLLRRGEVYTSGRTIDVLNEEALSSFFEYPVSVEQRDERYSIQLK
ncbi:ABC transporter ATP-binding protein [Fredinandcohnia quinoae]|uniref:ABC transporter ATP-binding protein n=1 Tax=Fredinandcohnia quinoae TaxID=2918902 RepID=A0AAW5E5T5_9BACI|nr:ABC transporter ATP-binding protein [Fredinandcohnia sp. SECRCQ15]MCH1625252.1 ABC transporter ATP-binding protein [Fredinandcohnia sp. SECRCQ15]